MFYRSSLWVRWSTISWEIFVRIQSGRKITFSYQIWDGQYFKATLASMRMFSLQSIILELLGHCWDIAILIFGPIRSFKQNMQVQLLMSFSCLFLFIGVSSKKEAAWGTRLFLRSFLTIWATTKNHALWSFFLFHLTYTCVVYGIRQKNIGVIFCLLLWYTISYYMRQWTIQPNLMPLLLKDISHWWA